MKKSILFLTMFAATGAAYACSDPSQHDPSAFEPGGECYAGGGNTPTPIVEVTQNGGSPSANAESFASGGNAIANGGDPIATSSVSFVGGSPSSSSSSNAASNASAGASSHSSSRLTNSGNSSITQTYINEADPITFHIPSPRSLRGAVVHKGYAPRRFWINGHGQLVPKGSGGIAVTAYGRKSDPMVQRMVAQAGASIICDIQNHGVMSRIRAKAKQRRSVTQQLANSFATLSKATRKSTKAILMIVDTVKYTRGTGANAGVGNHDGGVTGILGGVGRYSMSLPVDGTEILCLDTPISVNFYPTH